jgi:hypothetical protein
MKRLFTLSAIFILFAVLSVSAQWGTNTSRFADQSKLVLYFAGTLDTLGQTYDSLKSNRFSLEDYDQSGTYFSLNYIFTSTAGSPNTLIDLYGTDDGGTTNYYIAQLKDTSTSEAYTPVATNLSNYRFNEYFLIIEQVAPGRDGTTFKAWLHSPQKDPALKP